MRPRLALTTGVLLAALAASPSAAIADTPTSEGVAWRLEQPAPPPPPTGAAPAPAPIGLGSIGDIEFWAPNRGALITAGNDVVAPGVWSYDGVAWHQLSTVCGGTQGRIAWAGPNDFWTISDSRPGQVLPNGVAVGGSQLWDTSLCHFKDGAIVASYAMPVQAATSYLAMTAAVCLSASDCWFGGQRLSLRTEGAAGAFHLHWDGQNVTEVDGPAGRDVAGMAVYQGRLIESVAPQAGDVAPGEVASVPQLLHRILPFGSTSQPFVAFPTASLPSYDYGGAADDPAAAPTALTGMRLSANDAALWAVAGPQLNTPARTVAQPLTVLHDANGRWTELAGHDVDATGSSPHATDQVGDVAAEPGTDAAWISLQFPTLGASPAELIRMSGDGTVTDDVTLPAASDGIGAKGAADKLVCPAARDCWMSTTQGWLFHLSDGMSLPQDTGFAFSSLLTDRPLDASIPQQTPDAPPGDDSGVPSPFVPELPTISPTPPPPPKRRFAPLVTKMKKPQLVHGTTLVLRFNLTVKSKVRLFAYRKKRLVAHGRLVVMKRGPAKTTVRLQRSKWPTRLRLQVRPLAKVPVVIVRSSDQQVATTTSASSANVAVTPPRLRNTAAAPRSGSRR